MTDEQLNGRFDGLAHLIEDLTGQVNHRLDSTNQRLDRIDATLGALGRQVSAGTRTIAGFTEWMSKADADYTRVLAELAELKLRIAKLEGENGIQP